MKMTLSFPGLVFLVLAGLIQIFWISPTSSEPYPRDARFARITGLVMGIAGIVLYGLGRIG